MTGSFTWEKETDDSCGAYDCQQPQDFRNLRLEEGLSDLDQPYRLVISSLYELPLAAGNTGAATGHVLWSSALGGWQFNGIYTLQSGLPFDLSEGGGAQGTIRPDIVSKTSVKPGNIADYFNTAALAASPATLFTDGNEPEHQLQSPGDGRT